MAAVASLKHNKEMRTLYHKKLSQGKTEKQALICVGKKLLQIALSMLMVIFGGMGSIQGSIVGAVILVVFPESLRFLGMPSSIAAPLRQMI